MKRIIELTEDGSSTLFVPELNEHYHSVKGAQTESQYIFIEQGFNAFTPPSTHVLEIGFGTGLNTFLTLQAAEKQMRTVHYTSLEKYPLTWEEVDSLHYSNQPVFQQLHIAPWNHINTVTPHFHLHKIETDACNLLQTPQHARQLLNDHFTHIYFDAFAPEKQPEMWSEKLFQTLYNLLITNGVLTTYCAKGCIRRMLQSIGFQVERLPGPPGGKREILRASK